MISTMDMTTGEWERECSAPDVRLAPGGSMPHAEVLKANSPLQAGLCEYAAFHPLHAGMPIELATLDVDDFLVHMEEAAP